jgi:hypothetical protein
MKDFSLTHKSVAAMTLMALLTTTVLSASATAASKKYVTADSSSFCAAIESGSYKNVTPTPSSSYRKFIPKAITFYQALEAQAPNSSVDNALKDLVKILKSEEADTSASALGAAIAANGSNFLKDLASLTKALLKCV